MTRLQRSAVVGLAVVALLVGAVTVVASAKRGREERVAADATTTTSTTVPPSTVPSIAPTSTTYDLVPETTTTSAAPAPAPTTTSTTAAPLPLVTATGAVLKAPGTPTSRTMAGEDCQTLAVATADGVACGFAHAKSGVTLVWLVEGTSAGAHRRHAYVFMGSGGAVWKSVLEAVDPDGSRWQSVVGVAVDLSDDGGDEVVFGFRGVGSSLLGVDLVEAPGKVTAHRYLSRGSGRVSTGQLNTWSATGASASSPFDHDVIRWVDGGWRVVLRSQTAAADVPPSQL